MMFQHEIEAAVRQAENQGGRWLITSRSAKSAIGEMSWPAEKVKAEVHRLQFVEHCQILSITKAE